MATQYVTCFYCKEKFDKNAEPFAKPRSNRYAHEHCHQAFIDSIPREEIDKENLINYIKQLFGISRVGVRVTRQIETLIEENQYTYSGILKTLQYFYEVKGGDVSKARGGVGIVPYVYNDAFAYYKSIWAAQASNKDVSIEDLQVASRMVTIAPPTYAAKKRRSLNFLEEDADE